MSVDQIIPILLPKLGESIHSAIVVKWLKKVGDTVRLDEPLVEVSTDKVASEIPAPKAGRITEILCQEGSECLVGELLCHMTTSESGANPFLSPAVLQLAKERQISIGDLAQIRGSGEGGRITKGDVLAFKGVEKVDQNRCSLDPVRKTIKENLTRSFREIPQASIIDEVDVTELFCQIEEKKSAFLEKHQVKLTLTPLLIQIIAKAVQVFPIVNASLEGDDLILHPNINVGVAVDVDGNVIVPVILDCLGKELSEIAIDLHRLVIKAREKKIEQKDVAKSTITITNFGMTGVKIGIPMVRLGEAAIIGIGSINKKPVVVENDQIQVRSMINISISFDHRIIDGVYICKFMKQIKEEIKRFSSL